MSIPGFDELLEDLRIKLVLPADKPEENHENTLRALWLDHRRLPSGGPAGRVRNGNPVLRSAAAQRPPHLVGVERGRHPGRKRPGHTHIKGAA